MRRVLRVLSDLVLALFLLMTVLGISLDLMLIRLGGRDINILRGLNVGVTNITVTDARIPCPLGAFAIVQRCTAEQAQPGDGMLFFDDDATVTVGVFQGMQDGQAVLTLNQQQLQVDAARVKARYLFVYPGGYDLYTRIKTPVFMGAASLFSFALFVLLRVDWRRRRKPLSPTDAEISTLFK